VSRQPLFRDDSDCRRFLAEFDRAAAERGWSCLSYCLMRNHYHLLIELEEPRLSCGMQRLNGNYARSFNDRHGREGGLFDARFWSRQVTDDRHFHAAVRYINRNPVAARLCSDPATWPWSSHRELTGTVERGRIAVARTLLLLGGSDGADQERYLDLVGAPCREPIAEFSVRLPMLSAADRAHELIRLHRDLGLSLGDLAAGLDRSVRTLQRWMADPI
jgi:REP element-mobilizing transposase RayT